LISCSDTNVETLHQSEYLDAIIANFNYEGGCNAVNMTYVTGLG